jgi:hypothetical protein
MGIVDPPSGGLIGYSNYNLYDNCNNLIGVSVTVDVTEEMVAIPSAPSVAGIQSNGIGFQLNCLPRAGGKIWWQQYIMVVSRTGEDLRWGINNWDVNPADTDGIINQGGDLATLSSPFGAGYASIPVGYRLEIALLDDGDDNISGATFSMYDQNGAPVFPPKQVALTSLTDVNGHQITLGELSPIVDIDFIIGGYANGADTSLSQGAGTITYRAINALTVLNTFPSCTAGVNTAESSNVTYGELGSSPNTEITQTFQVYHPWFPIWNDQVKMLPGAAVTALWRSNDTHLDLFATGTDGTVWSTWWEDAPGWQQWFPIWNTQVKMQPGATVTALWRSNDTHLDLFATGPDGTVWTTWWEGAVGWNTPWMPIWNDLQNKGVKMQPGATVTALWRSNDTHLDLFATGPDGTVWTTWWEDKPGWQQWFPIWNQFGNNFKMNPGVQIAALWRSNNTHLDLFATGTDGAVWSIWWESGPGW